MEEQESDKSSNEQEEDISTKFFFYVTLPIFAVVYFILFCLGKFRKFKRYYKAVHDTIFWDGLIMYLLEGYLPLMMQYIEHAH